MCYYHTELTSNQATMQKQMFGRTVLLELRDNLYLMQYDFHVSVALTMALVLTLAMAYMSR